MGSHVYVRVEGAHKHIARYSSAEERWIVAPQVMCSNHIGEICFRSSDG